MKIGICTPENPLEPRFESIDEVEGREISHSFVRTEGDNYIEGDPVQHNKGGR